MEQLCKELTSTYDTNILDNEDKTVQDEFLNVSRKNRKNKGGKKVLMELICNHYDESVQKLKPNAEFIGGPKTLSIHWHPGFKKMIYIFGEWHSNITDCDKFEKDPKPKGERSSKPKGERSSKPKGERSSNPKGERSSNMILIEDYLYNLMQTTDVFLDIYIEIVSYKNGEYEGRQYVPGRTDELFKKFRTCLQYNTRSDISCQLARVHYFDIRGNDVKETNIEENKISILWFKEKLAYIILNKEGVKDAIFDLKLMLKTYPKILILLKELVNDDIKKVCEFMKKQLEENPYIKKELSKINNPQIKPFILTFYGKLIYKEVLRIIPIIKKDILNILNYEKKLDDVLLKSIETIEIFLGTTTTYFADVYLIARVFKDFDMEKKKDKSYFDQPNRAHNIIIYCGNTQAINNTDFLSSMGFHDIEHTGDLREDILNKIPKTPKYCLDMRKIKQPFFSYSNLPTTPKIVRKITPKIVRKI